MDLPACGPVLALDYGLNRIGVAVSDPQRLMALPLTVLQRQNRDQDLKALAALAREQQATLIILGLALQADDALSPTAVKTLAFGRRLSRFLELPVAYVDEWESTVQAQDLLLKADVSRHKRRRAVDKLAAACILERFLKHGVLAPYS